MKNNICIIIIIAILISGWLILFGENYIGADIAPYMNKIISALCILLFIVCRFSKNSTNNAKIHKQFVNDLFRQFKLANPGLENILDEHMKSLESYEIEATWVGCYINFTYKNKPKLIFEKIEVLGIKKILYINDIVEHFDVELNIKKGLMDFIEIVTYGDVNWDGEIEKWRFEELENKNEIL